MDEPQVVTVESCPTAVVRGTVPADQLAAFFDAAFQRLPAAIAADGAQIAGAAFARYPSPPGDVVELEVGFPVDRPIEATDDVGAGSLPAGRVARVVHAGSFEELGTSWGRLREWMADQGHRPAPGFWEVYLTEPSPGMDPADLRTELNWPVAG